MILFKYLAAADAIHDFDFGRFCAFQVLLKHTRIRGTGIHSVSFYSDIVCTETQWIDLKLGCPWFF